jgi:DNA-binding SARP family transcriptional activator
MVRFAVLGPLLIRRGDSEIPVDAVKLRILLAVLLCRVGRPVPVPAIMNALWYGDCPATAAKTLQVYVHRLRKALGDPELIRHDAASYWITVEPAHVDALLFESLIARARTVRVSGDVLQARALLNDALSLWRGPAYAGMTEATHI